MEVNEKGSKSANNYYFCSAKLRPDCIHPAGNICCLHCRMIDKCQFENRKPTKPCTTKIIGMDDACEFSV